MKPAGNTVLITGGATGIGLALAQKLMDENNQVIVCGRRKEALDAAAKALPGLTIIQADITNPTSLAALVDTINEQFPNLNVLINNAGHVKVTDVADANFLETLEVETATSFLAPVSLSVRLLPLLRRQPEATIANVTTGYVLCSGARTAPYSATKTALHSMTQTMRYMLKNTSVRVVEIIPSAYDTAMSSHFNGKKDKPEKAAQLIFKGLVANKSEFTVTIPAILQLIGRLMPQLVFKAVNDGETRAAARLGAAR